MAAATTALRVSCGSGFAKLASAVAWVIFPPPSTRQSDVKLEDGARAVLTSQAIVLPFSGMPPLKTTPASVFLSSYPSSRGLHRVSAHLIEASGSGLDADASGSGNRIGARVATPTPWPEFRPPQFVHSHVWMSRPQRRGMA